MTDVLPALGTFQTRDYTLAAGAQLEIETDSDQVLVLELDGADTIGLRLNHGATGQAFKGFEARGLIRHLAFENSAADAVRLQIATVKGVEIRDRRLNQVGDLGLVTTYDLFDALGAVTIPANSVRQVATADAARRFLVLTNPPGQFRELYISGASFTVPSAALTNGGFETGDLTGWTEIGTGQVAARAAGDVNMTPHSGGFAAYLTSSADETLRQDIDLLARGFDAATIDAGGLVLNAEAWIYSENGSDAGTFTVRFLDNAAAEISNLTSGAQAPNQVWGQQQLAGVVPAGTRTVRVELFFDNISVGGNPAFDDVSVTIDGQPPTADELAGMIMPSTMISLPTSGDLFAFNPHTSDQDILVGEIRGA